MKSLKKYLAKIGAKGGKASRRKITPEQQAAMQEARKAAKLRKEQNALHELPPPRGSESNQDATGG